MEVAKNKAEILVKKNRHGGQKNIQVYCDFSTFSISDLTEKY